MNLHDAYKRYEARQLRSASAATLNLWRISLRHFDRFLCRPAKLADLNDDTVSAFAVWRRRQCVSPATINRDLASLLALWRWCHRKGLHTTWPDVPLEQEPTRVPVCWTQDEFSKLMSAVDKLDYRVGRIPARLWWRALLLVCFDTGERIGAVLSLNWQRVDLTHRWIVFDALTRKGRDTDNAVRIASDTAVALYQIRRQGSDRVFHWPHSKCVLWKRYDAILIAAGLPHDRWHKFHCIRKTTASHYEAAGGNATELLKHASRRNTLAYLDPRVVRPVQGIDLLWRPKLPKP